VGYFLRWHQASAKTADTNSARALRGLAIVFDPWTPIFFHHITLS